MTSWTLAYTPPEALRITKWSVSVATVGIASGLTAVAPNGHPAGALSAAH